MAVEQVFMLLAAVGLSFGALPWRKSRGRSQQGAEREQAENETRTVEERFRALAQNTSDLVYRYRLKPTPGFELVSPSVTAMTGYTPEEYYADPELGYKIVHPEDRHLFDGAWRNAETPTTLRWRRKDGTILWTEQRIKPTYDEAGELVAIEGIARDVTEAKEAEQTLSEVERRYADLLSSVRAYVYRCRNEPGWPNEFASDYALELTGYAPEDLLVGSETPFGDLIVEEDRERVWEEVQSALRRGGHFRLQYTIRRRDGGTRRVEEYGRGVYDGEGHVVALEGIVYDVTELKQAEDRLREAETRYRTLVEQIPAITYIQEASGSKRITYMSPQIEDMLGYSPEEEMLDEHHWIKIMHPSDRERVLAEDERTDETGEPFRVEYRQLAKDGRVVWIRDEAVLVRDERGNPKYWLGVQLDITERKRAEKALRESELRLRTVISNVPVVLFALDRGGVFTLSEGKGLDVLGLDSGEVVGRSVSEVFGDRPKILADVDRALEGEKFSAVRDVGPWTFEIRYSPLRASTGEISGVIGLAADVTERKRAEKALKESELRLRTVISNVPVILFALDNNGTITLSEGEGLKTLGLKPNETVGKSVFELYRDRPEFLDYARRALAGEAITTTVRLDGVVLEIRSSPLRDEAGEISGVIGVATDITERKAFEDRLEFQAFHDAMTRLPNRASFTHRLKEVLDQADRRQGYVAVMVLDLDNFRIVNDSLGHEAGDLLLVAVAERLQRCLRPRDTVARLGGDQFAVLLDDIGNVSEAVRVAERIQESLQTPVSLLEQEISLTASIGIALGTTAQDQPEDLLRNADTAMYWAKDGGKAQHEVFDPSMDIRASEHLALGRDLRSAIERDELCLRYQPQILLDTGGVVGMTASVYWEHPERGLMHPSEFIPVAEGSRLILPIGHWTLREACQQAAQWQERYRSDLPLMVSVDLSARQFRQQELPRDVARLLRETGLESRSLNLRVSESVAMKDPHYTISTLEDLKGLGVQLSISNFGTGYSSLSHLNRFPIDFLVIDSSFVDNLWEGSADATVVSGMISLAHALGITAVAVGVETSKQVTQLQRLGCNLAQGDYFSEPLTSGAASRYLAAAFGYPGDEESY